MPFNETEVYEALRNMVKYKALAPDGFSMGYFRSYWEVVKDDMMKIVQEIISFGKFEKSLNTAFIELIPKKVGAVTCEWSACIRLSPRI